MRLLQFVLSMMLLILFLYIAWPLFLGLFILIAGYWIWAVYKLRQSAKQAFKNFEQQETIERPMDSGDVIDAQYTEREE